jgi:molybdopterin-containing oxidoreductase family membrane subunit
MIRDRARVRGNQMYDRIYSLLSFGWSGKVRDWARFEEVSLVLAGLATPLVFSVHSIVSMDFAAAIVPGWHTTIFPPYFVLGALFSGFAMVLTLTIIMRKVMNLENYITIRHVESMNFIIILTGSLVGTAYISELFISWYSGVEYEQYAFINRATGPYYWAYAIMMTCNVLSPQLFWFKKIRTSFAISFVMSIFINIGMWFERFVIIVTSLHRDYLPSSWTMFHPTFVDIGVFIGTIGIFFTLFLLFARVFPVIAQAETKSILKVVGSQYYGANATSAPAKELVAEKEEDSRADSGDEGADEEDSGENKTEDE